MPILTYWLTPAEPARSYFASLIADLGARFDAPIFDQFQSNEEVTALSATFRAASTSQEKYELNPHLSLIYKTMPRETKAEIANSLSLPFHEVRFDAARAVISPAKIESREDVESWRIVATQSFAG
jgi:hypothetical protein